MLPWMTLFCLAAAVPILTALAVIDLKTRLLPDRLVLPFAVLGIAFHLSAGLAYMPPVMIAAGGAAGAGSLYLIRTIANRLYGMDALGLGDVKLMGAAGLWLGPEGVMLALALGAFAGLLHGLGYGVYQAVRTKEKPDFARLQIPAGPGFAVGIVLAGLYLFG